MSTVFLWGRGKGKRTRMPGGFTLVEMLVAVSIFLIIIIMLAQVLTSVSSLALQQNNRMTSVMDTRQALNRFGQDWQARVRRPDVDWLVTSAGTPTASITFFSHVSGLAGNRGVATVSYQVLQPENGLQRGTTGYDFLSTGATPTLTFTGTSSVLSPTVPVIGNFETMAPTIFRIAISYLDSTTGKWAVGSPAKGLNDSSMAAVAFTVVSIDSKSRAILSNAQLNALNNALGEVSGNFDPKATWVTKLETPGFAASAGVPNRAAAAVNVDQRIFSVNE